MPAADKQIERSIIDELARRLRKLDDWPEYTVQDSERPDFILEATQPPLRIGVEVTRSVFQEYIRGSKLHGTTFDAAVIDTTRLFDRDERRSNAELIEDMTDPNDRWQNYEEYAALWAQKIRRCVDAKRLALNADGFTILEMNWLVIHDEPGLSHSTIDLSIARDALSSIFTAPTAVARDYDAIFIISAQHLFRWMRGALSWRFDN